MRELPFQVELEWSGSGRDGAGRIVTDDLQLELSAPASMGGRGVGTNPEELLVCAVASCYAGTLLGVLRRIGLPAASVSIDARGSVSGYPDRARFERIVVSPTIIEGDGGRVHEYELAASGCARPLLHRPYDCRQRRLPSWLGSGRAGGSGRNDHAAGGGGSSNQMSIEAATIEAEPIDIGRSAPPSGRGALDAPEQVIRIDRTLSELVKLSVPS